MVQYENLSKFIHIIYTCYSFLQVQKLRTQYISLNQPLIDATKFMGFAIFLQFEIPFKEIFFLRGSTTNRPPRKTQWSMKKPRDYPVMWGL